MCDTQSHRQYIHAVLISVPFDPPIVFGSYSTRSCYLLMQTDKNTAPILFDMQLLVMWWWNSLFDDISKPRARAFSGTVYYLAIKDIKDLKDI